MGGKVDAALVRLDNRSVFRDPDDFIDPDNVVLDIGPLWCGSRKPVAPSNGMSVHRSLCCSPLIMMMQPTDFWYFPVRTDFWPLDWPWDRTIHVQRSMCSPVDDDTRNTWSGAAADGARAGRSRDPGIRGEYSR